MTVKLSFLQIQQIVYLQGLMFFTRKSYNDIFSRVFIHLWSCGFDNEICDIIVERIPKINIPKISIPSRTHICQLFFKYDSLIYGRCNDAELCNYLQSSFFG